MAKESTTCSIEELERNPETVMKLTGCVACSEHREENIQYYCKDHTVPCCGTCINEGHKTCDNVIEMEKELPALLCDSKPDEILTDMMEIEIHLKKFMEMNESCVDTLGAQINKLTDQIREVRKKINVFLDEIETQVNADGSRIYKEVGIQKQFDNHQCLTLIHAVRSSQHLFDTVNRDGSNLQKYLIAEKVRSQLRSYSRKVLENYENIQNIKLMVELSPKLLSILSVPVSELVKVKSIAGSNILPLKGSRRQTQKNCQVDVCAIVDLNIPTGVVRRSTTGITILPGGRLILIDHHNKQCILINSSYQFITSHTLAGIPWNVCVLDDQEVAVSFIDRNIILILSVVDDVFRPARIMPTKYNCNGIAAAGKGEMVVNCYCGNSKSQWCLLNTEGDIKYSHMYDCPVSHSETYHYCVALNNAKTRVYISADNMDSLLGFDLDGTKLFTYNGPILVYPKGVAVDRYDNIYVIGLTTNNIHQLSPDGSVLQVITSGVPLCPHAICIDKSKDMLVITSLMDTTKLHIYQLT